MALKARLETMFNFVEEVYLQESDPGALTAKDVELLKQLLKL